MFAIFETHFEMMRNFLVSLCQVRVTSLLSSSPYEATPSLPSAFRSPPFFQAAAGNKTKKCDKSLRP